MRSAVVAFVFATSLFALTHAARTESRNILFGLENGELCVEGDQCKSYCCQRDSYSEIARCHAYTPEGKKCQNDGLWDVYEYCPCEMGLSCEKASDGEKYCVDPYIL